MRANSTDLGDHLFTPVTPRRSFDDVTDQIREAIIAGQLNPGDRLPAERVLCETFGVSRATLRESLRALEATGLLTVRPGAAGGVFIAEPSPRWVADGVELMVRLGAASPQELAEFRATFEGENAHWGALRRTDKILAEMTEVVTRFEELSASPDVTWDVLSRLDLTFHELVAKASRNQIRIGIMSGISQALLRASGSLKNIASGTMRVSIAEELRTILAAFDGSDQETARRLMRSHVEKYAEIELFTSHQ